MRTEPIVLGLRDAFDALLGDQLFGACMHFQVHAAPPWSAPRRASSPRYRRDFTVESGTLKTPAISSICNSSWKRRRALHDRSRGFSATRPERFLPPPG